MKKILKSAVAIVVALQFVACSHHQAQISYDEFKDMHVQAGPIAGAEDLGRVKGEHGGAIWDECTQKARDSVNRMIGAARAKGANAIGDVRWTDGNTSTPTCKKGWGYFVIWPFVLTPLFMSTEVTGEAYKTTAPTKHSKKGKEEKSGLYMLPTNPALDTQVVEKILAAK
jgi:hypothetical protein